MKKYFIHRNNMKAPDFRKATNEAVDQYVKANTIEADSVKVFANGNIILKDDLEEVVFFGNCQNVTLSKISK